MEADLGKILKDISVFRICQFGIDSCKTRLFCALDADINETIITAVSNEDCSRVFVISNSTVLFWLKGANCSAVEASVHIEFNIAIGLARNRSLVDECGTTICQLQKQNDDSGIPYTVVIENATSKVIATLKPDRTAVCVEIGPGLTTRLAMLIIAAAFRMGVRSCEFASVGNLPSRQGFLAGAADCTPEYLKSGSYSTRKEATPTRPSDPLASTVVSQSPTYTEFRSTNVTECLIDCHSTAFGTILQEPPKQQRAVASHQSKTGLGTPNRNGHTTSHSVQRLSRDKWIVIYQDEMSKMDKKLQQHCTTECCVCRFVKRNKQRFLNGACQKCHLFFMKWYIYCFVYTCQGRKDCDVSHDLGKVCGYCKLQKCFAVGMVVPKYATEASYVPLFEVMRSECTTASSM